MQQRYVESSRDIRVERRIVVGMSLGKKHEDIDCFGLAQRKVQ
jgi:hypothetical protein